MVPLIASHIDETVAWSQEQYQTLQQAQATPHVLDDYTVNRVIEVFTAQQNDLWLFDEQLRRWNAGVCTPEQRTEVGRLVTQMQVLHTVTSNVLALANELQAHTKI